MNTKLTIIRCPQLDRLNRNLIEAYRALEDREVFAGRLAASPISDSLEAAVLA